MSIGDNYPCPKCGSKNLNLVSRGRKKRVVCADCGCTAYWCASWKSAEESWKNLCDRENRSNNEPAGISTCEA